MSRSVFTDAYISLLRSAMRRATARVFVFSRLEASLGAIGIEGKCRNDIFQLLTLLTLDDVVTGTALGSAVDEFQRRWRSHLDRAYFRDYEATRWGFVEEHVLGNVRVPLGRCLDIGCGRGCITAALASQDSATEVVGIDGTDFTPEWRERAATSPSNVSFRHVAVDNLSEWARSCGRFDTIFLFYVLHHSSDYWAERTLHSLKTLLHPTSKIIIIEDTFIESEPAKSDPGALRPQWSQWIRSAPTYRLSVGFDVQIVLDFVAVQLLASFVDVEMACNYRTGTDWVSIFERLGFGVECINNIGFPGGRDIDVPQGCFVLTPQAKKPAK